MEKVDSFLAKTNFIIFPSIKYWWWAWTNMLIEIDKTILSFNTALGLKANRNEILL